MAYLLLWAKLKATSSYAFVISPPTHIIFAKLIQTRILILENRPDITNIVGIEFGSSCIVQWVPSPE